MCYHYTNSPFYLQEEELFEYLKYLRYVSNYTYFGTLSRPRSIARSLARSIARSYERTTMPSEITDNIA